MSIVWLALDKNNTNGTCHIFKNCLIIWHNKKQHNVALSTIEVKYVVASTYYAQVLWLKQQILDYDLKLGCVSIKCDNTIVISLTKNNVLHSHTKHMKIRHHFLRDNVEIGNIICKYVGLRINLLIFN